MTRTQISVKDQSYRLEVLDIAGSLDLQDDGKLEKVGIQKMDGIVLVYDITSRKSFDRIEYLHRRIREIKSQGTSDSVVPSQTMPPVVIVGNKNDMVPDRVISLKEGLELAERLGCMFDDTSATNYEGALRVFEKVVKEWVESDSLGDYTGTSLLGGGSTDGCCVIM
ncbi:putative small G-protein Ras2 [Nemania serpens]|nr:putative small G-protein Ras2 [Nemania serpens]